MTRGAELPAKQYVVALMWQEPQKLWRRARNHGSRCFSSSSLTTCDINAQSSYPSTAQLYFTYCQCPEILTWHWQLQWQNRGLIILFPIGAARFSLHCGFVRKFTFFGMCILSSLGNYSSCKFYKVPMACELNHRSSF